MKRFTVAATQVEVRNAEVEHNLETHLRLIAEIAESGCELVVFPELSVTGHNASVDVIRSAERPHLRQLLLRRLRPKGARQRAPARAGAAPGRPPAPPRLHDALARDNGVSAIFSDQVGFHGHSTHVGGAYILAPDGGMLARSEPGTGTSWISAELDPALLERVREAPSFALRKRRPDTYRELTTPA